MDSTKTLADSKGRIAKRNEHKERDNSAPCLPCEPCGLNLLIEHKPHAMADSASFIRCRINADWFVRSIRGCNC